MTSLDLAHELGYIWVVRLSDGHVGQLEPPESGTSSPRPNSPSFQDVFGGWADSSDADPWSQPPLGEPVITIRQSLDSGAGQERLLAGLEPSPALRRVSEASAGKPEQAVTLHLTDTRSRYLYSSGKPKRKDVVIPYLPIMVLPTMSSPSASSASRRPIGSVPSSGAKSSLCPDSSSLKACPRLEP
jgi:hypothetical protein